MPKSISIFQLHAALDEIQPLIWRRLQVPAAITLEKLHFILQDAFGWTNSHLHSFEIGKERFGMLDPDGWDDLADEAPIRLENVAKPRSRFVYEYDFGDSWRHLIKVEKLLPAEPSIKYPRCLDGARACPPEDVGGPYGYMELVDAIANPKHPRRRELMEWCEPGFDPERFDLAAINKALWGSRTQRLTRRAMRE